MNGLNEPMDGAQIAVLLMRGRWTVLVDGEPAGGFSKREAAIACAFGLELHPWLSHSVREVLISSHSGEVLRAASR